VFRKKKTNFILLAMAMPDAGLVSYLLRVCVGLLKLWMGIFFFVDEHFFNIRF